MTTRPLPVDRLRRLVALVAIVLLAVACGGDDGGSDGAATPDPPSEAETEEPVEPEPEPEPEPAEEQSGLPETPVVAVADRAADFSGAEAHLDTLPVQPGEVEAHWYRAGATYAVVYVGLDPSVNACPGNSIQLATGAFEFVSNAELPGGSCPDFPTRIENTDTEGVKVCDGVVSYLTRIPVSEVGVLYAGIETQGAVAGTGAGVYSMVAIDDPTTASEIDPAVLAC